MAKDLFKNIKPIVTKNKKESDNKKSDLKEKKDKKDKKNEEPSKTMVLKKKDNFHKNISDLAEEFNHESPSTLLKENNMLREMNKKLESKLKQLESSTATSQKSVNLDDSKSDSNLMNYIFGKNYRFKSTKSGKLGITAEKLQLNSKLMAQIF